MTEEVPSAHNVPTQDPLASSAVPTLSGFFSGLRPPGNQDVFQSVTLKMELEAGCSERQQEGGWRSREGGGGTDRDGRAAPASFPRLGAPE
ncbi:unnamed protein product [Arctogadus glacialis]